MKNMFSIDLSNPFHLTLLKYKGILKGKNIKKFKSILKMLSLKKYWP